MKLDTLLEAQQLARQLDHLIGVAIDEQNGAKHTNQYVGDGKYEKQNPYCYDIKRGDLHSGHLAAGIKRKSMDLTRQLAKMRRGD